MGIKLNSLDPSLKTLVMGMQIGDIWFVDGTAGDDNATGVDQDHAIKTIAEGLLKTVSAHNDYLLCYGTLAPAAALAIPNSHVHMLGIGGGGMLNEAGRGAVVTCPATVDTIIPAATADYLEIAGFLFNQNATDHILIDDAGATDIFFHHNTVFGSTTASDAIRLDLEGARSVVNDNIFHLCKLAIDVVGAESVVKRNHIDSVNNAAKGIVLGAAAHRSIVASNWLGLSGGTGDVGITITSGAVSCQILDNDCDADCADAISDSGTTTLLVGNRTAGITGTTAASLALFNE